MSTQTAVQTQANAKPKITPVAGGLLQRACACGQHTSSGGGECEECKKKRQGMLQRSATNAAPVGEVPPIVHEVLRSPGRPLDAATLAYMEPRFGHDFSGVHIHSDSQAAKSARAVNALAYTVGRDVVFGAQRYAPTTNAGRRLLAHELTHVVQQGDNPASLQRKLTVNTPGDAAEHEADRLADAIVSSSVQKNEVHPRISATPSIQRTCSDGRCDDCVGGRHDFWVTVFFRRRATAATMANLRTQINDAKAILAHCCLDLKFDFDWRLLRGSATFPAGAARPAGDPLGGWDYPADAETLGEGNTFSGARGVPMLVVDDVPGSGGGVTMIRGVDAEYTGPNYFAIAVNQTAPNPNCNHIAHELWHMTGAARHDVADGAITACTSNVVSPTYCNALRSMVAPVGDFSTPPRNRDTAIA
jgi:hypothetical protein